MATARGHPRVVFPRVYDNNVKDLALRLSQRSEGKAMELFRLLVIHVDPI